MKNNNNNNCNTMHKIEYNEMKNTLRVQVLVKY